MRVLLFTGKGGVGKTTVAAATAVLAARRGCKTLVVSTDGAHSLGDAFGVALGPEPTEVESGLYGQQIDVQRRLESSWRDVQGWLVALLEKGGVDPLAAEELTVLPGAEEVLSLLAVREQVTGGDWDLVVVDCAPTAETLRLLALPEALGWYMDRVFPVQRRIARLSKPLLGRGTAVPTDAVFAAVVRLHAELAEVRAVLVDPAVTGVRLVLTPEAVVVEEARRTLTALSLHGYRVDAVVANRVFPPASKDPWARRWAAAQAVQLDAVLSDFAPLPVLQAEYGAAEPVGAEALALVAAELYGATDPWELSAVGDAPWQVEQTTDGFALVVALPFATKGEVELVRRGDEIVVTVGAQRRVVALPSALRRCTVVGAALRDGALRIAFEPDPAVWMHP